MTYIPPNPPAQSTQLPMFSSSSRVPASWQSSTDTSEDRPRSAVSQTHQLGLSLPGTCFNHRTPSVTHQTMSRAPALTFRVGPEQVTHGPVMRHLLLSVNCPDLVQCLDGGGKAPVHTEDLQGRVRQAGGRLRPSASSISPIPGSCLAGLPCHR